MTRMESIFRVVSLALVGVGFVAVVAGADKDGDKTVTVIEDLIHDIKTADEVHKINTGELSKNPQSVETTVPQKKPENTVSR